MKKKNYFKLMLPFFIILILDQVTKIFTSDTFSTIIPKFLYINSFKNEAMIFNLGHHVILLTILIVLTLGFLFLFYRHYLHYTDKYELWYKGYDKDDMHWVSKIELTSKDAEQAKIAGLIV